LPQFGTITPGIVQGVIDHHDDEEQHLDAEVRVLAKTGSCSSLVVTHFLPAWQASLAGPAGEAGSPVPNEVATLLLSAGLIDTHGFKAGAKAIDQDYQAAAFTYPLSPWYTSSSSGAQSVTETFIPPALHDQGKELNDIKQNVSFLSSHDLLLRDYKEYNLPTASTAFPVLRVGLSTVPLGLKDWLAKGEDGWAGLMSDVDKYMIERNLDIEGVLTTFKKKGVKKREILLIVRIGGALDNAAAERAIVEIGAGMEKDTILTLVKWEKRGWKRFLNKRKRQHLDGKRRFGRVWEQANAEATRKVVAPLMVCLNRECVVGRV
jgi:exopolyphosphatase